MEGIAHQPTRTFDLEASSGKVRSSNHSLSSSSSWSLGWFTMAHQHVIRAEYRAYIHYAESPCHAQATNRPFSDPTTRPLLQCLIDGYYRYYHCAGSVILCSSITQTDFNHNQNVLVWFRGMGSMSRECRCEWRMVNKNMMPKRWWLWWWWWCERWERIGKRKTNKRMLRLLLLVPVRCLFVCWHFWWAPVSICICGCGRMYMCGCVCMWTRVCIFRLNVI